MTSIRKEKKRLKRELKRVDAYLKKIEDGCMTEQTFGLRILAKYHKVVLEVALRTLSGDIPKNAIFILPHDLNTKNQESVKARN